MTQSVQNSLFSLRVVSDCARRQSFQKLIFPSVSSIYKRKEEIKKIHRFVGVRNVKYSGNVDEGGAPGMPLFVLSRGWKGRTSTESFVNGERAASLTREKRIILVITEKNTTALRDRCDTLSNELRFSFDWKIFRFCYFLLYRKSYISSRRSWVTKKKSFNNTWYYNSILKLIIPYLYIYLFR